MASINCVDYKLIHLFKSALTFFDLIKNDSMTDIHFDVTIERPKQFYNNRGLVIRSHIKSLIEYPYVETQSSSELKSFHTHLCTHDTTLNA